MILLNTTFVLHAPLEEEFLAWVKGVYLPDTESIAVQLPAADAEAASRWLDTTAAQLHSSLQARWGERMMFFTTALEVIDL